MIGGCPNKGKLILVHLWNANFSTGSLRRPSTSAMKIVSSCLHSFPSELPSATGLHLSASSLSVPLPAPVPGRTQSHQCHLGKSRFQEHFTSHGNIHAGNYDAYYRPEDIERQMILESYGYKFWRINRFNLGRDPVATLSERLYGLINAAKKNEDLAVISTIRDSANGLGEGSSKHCRKCDKVKPKELFFDSKLRSGKGGYGKMCLGCKTNRSSVG